MARQPPPADPSLRRPWLSHNLKTLSAVSFLQDAASELLYPILPLFITAVLGAPVVVVGAVEGVAEAVAALTKVLSGRLSDRAGRKTFVTAGYGLAAVGKILIAVATVWPIVLLARCIDRVGKGIRAAPRDALIVDGVPAQHRGSAFGFHRAMDTSGAVVGPLLGLAGYELLNHQLRPLFVIAVVPAVASVFLTRTVVESRRRPVSVAPVGRGGATGHAAAVLRRKDEPLPPRFWSVVAVLALFGLINFPDSLLLLRASELGLGTAGVIAAYALYNAVYAALSYPAGWLSDRVPRRYVMAVGFGFFAVGYVGLALIRSPGLVFVILPLYGGFAACTDGVGKAWISSLLPADRQGFGQGLYQGMTGAAVLVAGLWAGFSWDGTGRGPLLISGAVAVLLAAVLLVQGHDRLPPPKTSR